MLRLQLISHFLTTAIQWMDLIYDQASKKIKMSEIELYWEDVLPYYSIKVIICCLSSLVINNEWPAVTNRHSPFLFTGKGWDAFCVTSGALAITFSAKRQWQVFLPVVIEIFNEGCQRAMGGARRTGIVNRCVK